MQRASSIASTLWEFTDGSNSYGFDYLTELDMMLYNSGSAFKFEKEVMLWKNRFPFLR
jgi:hypothetical protein